MIRLLAIIFFVAVLAFAASNANSQDCPHPSGCVTISRDAALKALADADRVKALEELDKAKDTAIEQLRAELNNMRIEFARMSGENTALKQNSVSDRAIIEVLLKSTKKKCVGLVLTCW